MVDAEMKHSSLLPSERIEFLLLERRLLMDGKLVPDAGGSAEHIEQRLKQIEREVRACREDAAELLHGGDGALSWGSSLDPSLDPRPR